MPKKKKPMQWEVRDLQDGRWGVFLKQEFCKTDEPVCYGACRTHDGATKSAKRMNDEAIRDQEEATHN